MVLPLVCKGLLSSVLHLPYASSFPDANVSGEHNVRLGPPAKPACCLVQAVGCLDGAGGQALPQSIQIRDWAG